MGVASRHRPGGAVAPRRLFIFAAALMVATGLGFGRLSSLWPLLIVAFVGTIGAAGQFFFLAGLLTAVSLLFAFRQFKLED